MKLGILTFLFIFTITDLMASQEEMQAIARPSSPKGKEEVETLSMEDLIDNAEAQLAVLRDPETTDAAFRQEFMSYLHESFDALRKHPQIYPTHERDGYFMWEGDSETGQKIFGLLQQIYQQLEGKPWTLQFIMLRRVKNEPKEDSCQPELLVLKHIQNQLRAAKATATPDSQNQLLQRDSIVLDLRVVANARPLLEKIRTVLGEYASRHPQLGGKSPEYIQSIEVMEELNNEFPHLFEEIPHMVELPSGMPMTEEEHQVELDLVMAQQHELSELKQVAANYLDYLQEATDPEIILEYLVHLTTANEALLRHPYVQRVLKGQFYRPQGHFVHQMETIVHRATKEFLKKIEEALDRTNKKLL